MKRKPINFIVYQLLFLFIFSSLFSIDLRAGEKIKTGAERLEAYLSYLRGKNIGIVANQTTIIGKNNLVDSLYSLKLNIKKILCPEHGFRGEAEAGEIIKNSVDAKTGIPIVSIYTVSKKPTPEDLKGLDIVIFDIQDVGTRFFTNISHLHYVMESCAENNIEVMILDRPNPHGFYVDGPPVLDSSYHSFVGMHSVPVVHGMTIGEYAMMINGEGWLNKKIKCRLKVIPCESYTHDSLYSLPVKPSPNLPNMTAIYLYPSICFFEGTVFSLGRGTEFPFQVYGHPSLKNHVFSFTPVSRKEAINPPRLNQKCFGVDLRNYDVNKIIKRKKIDFSFLIDAYNSYKAVNDTASFFTSWLDTLSGNGKLREQFIKGMTEDEIRETWKIDIEKFMKIRKKYLLYKDFQNK